MAHLAVSPRPTRKDGVTPYQAVIHFSMNGLKDHETVGTFDTKKEAEKAGYKALEKYETNIQKTAAIRGKITLRAWFEEWLPTLDGIKKEGTPDHYEWRMTRWVLPRQGNVELGKIMLVDLSPVHIRRWLRNLKGVRGGPLANGSKKDALFALKGCLRAAVSDGVLTSNPAQDVSLEDIGITQAIQKQERRTKKIKSWTDASHPALLLRACEGMRIEPLILMGLCQGLRPGETGGLRKDDFHWSFEPEVPSSFTVARSRTSTPKRMILTDSPKSGDDRTLDMEPEIAWRMMAVLERQKECHHGMRGGKPIPGALLPPCEGDCEWVFTMDPGTARTALKKLERQLGIPELPPHAMRHTFGSLLESANIPAAARAAIMGHSVQTNTNTYTHAMNTDVRRAGAMITGILLPPNTTPDPAQQVQNTQ